MGRKTEKNAKKTTTSRETDTKFFDFEFHVKPGATPMRFLDERTFRKKSVLPRRTPAASCSSRMPQSSQIVQDVSRQGYWVFVGPGSESTWTCQQNLRGEIGKECGTAQRCRSFTGFGHPVIPTRTFF